MFDDDDDDDDRGGCFSHRTDVFDPPFAEVLSRGRLLLMFVAAVVFVVAVVVVFAVVVQETKQDSSHGPAINQPISQPMPNMASLIDIVDGKHRELVGAAVFLRLFFNRRNRSGFSSVSYTHLTLPTIYSV